MSRFCLVYQSSPVIARDLAITLEDLTGCTPLIVPDMDAAEEAITTLGPEAELGYAFVHLGVNDYRNSLLRQMLDRLSARVVLLGHAAETEAGASDWPVLAQPFSTSQVAELLARLEAGTMQPPDPTLS